MTGRQFNVTDPAAFIEQHLFDSETQRPYKLLPAERAFLAHAFKLGDDGRLVYPEQVYGAIKKSGKTGFAALHLLVTTLLFGGRYSEGYACANDLEQAQGRVFQQVRRIVEVSPLLRREAKITQDKITFPSVGAAITALASDYASAAGGHPTISVFDELWGYVSERSRRLFDEMVPVPTRRISLRLTVTHAGFEGESLLLQELYRRGLRQPSIGPDLYAGDGLLLFWSHEPIAPWQTEKWLAEMRRTLRANQYARMIENRFVVTDSAFIEMSQWDQCVAPNYRPVVSDRHLPVWVGVDASVKHDSTALCAVTFDPDPTSQRVRLVNHKIFQPSPTKPIEFEEQIENTVLDWHARYKLMNVRFDPYQMVAVAQRLTRAGVPTEEFAQTVGNLTEASSNLYELVTGRNIVLYPDADMRLAVSRAVAIESVRGWRIAKDKAAHKIDIVVALAQAAHAAVLSHKCKPPGRARMFAASLNGIESHEIDPATGGPMQPSATTVQRLADGRLILQCAPGSNACIPTDDGKHRSAWPAKGCV